MRALKRQTASSYKPDVFLSFHAFNQITIDNWKNETKRNITLWQNHNSIPYETLGLLFSIENVGFGVARNISINWKFDIEAAIKQIQSHLINPYKICSDQYSCWIFNSNNPETEIFDLSLNLFNELDYDFILPRKDEKFDMSPSIPKEIIQFFVIFFISKYHLINHNDPFVIIGEEFEDFQKLDAIVTYFDIGGKQHKKRFRVKLHLSISNLAGKLVLNQQENLMIDLYPSFHQIEK